MPIPYNIWGGDFHWLAYGQGRFTSGHFFNEAFSWWEGMVPQRAQNEDWVCYHVLGHPEDPPQAPYFHPEPWGVSYTAEPYALRYVMGWAYEPVKGVISYYIWWGEPGGLPGSDAEGYGAAISNHLQHGRGGVEVLDHTYDGAFVWDDPQYGSSAIWPSNYNTMAYAYSSEGAQPLLVMNNWDGLTLVSWDWGESWSEPAWPEFYYDYPGEGGCGPFSEVAMGWGPEGSDTICVAGGNDCWRSTDNGQTMDITYAPYDWLNEGKWDPASCHAHIGDFFTIQSNGKQDPDCVWVAVAYYGLDSPEKFVQRNLTPTCEPGGWEDRAYFLVSEDFQDDIFEGTNFYPPDHSCVSCRGDPYTFGPVIIGLKYLPGTDRWWALGHDYSGRWLLFSDDQGITWSKILCDHANEENWPSMHPFFSPRMWPWNESYQQSLAMNMTGYWSSVLDIVEHPDDPNIVVALGECWLKVDYAVGDPAGRFGGTFEPVMKTWVEEAEFLKFKEYSSWADGWGDDETCLCVSLDGGLTWGQPFGITPYSPDYNHNNPRLSRLGVVRR